MSEPERLRPEQAVRVERTMIELAGNVAARRNLPSLFLTFFRDDVTGERFFAFVMVDLVQEDNRVLTTTSFIGNSFHRVAKETSTVEVIDGLLEQLRDLSIVCDPKTADELSKHSLTWLEEDHYRLEGRPNGVIEVYTPYRYIKLPDNDPRASDKKGGYLFEE